VSWAGADRRVRFVSWLSGNVAVVKGMAAMPPAAIGKLGQAHALARHIGDFLTDLANAGASGHTGGLPRRPGPVRRDHDRGLSLAKRA
jgi:hypothetical protein